ncbi:AMP-binding enzyme [Pseudoduganella aquatica]|uniref:4-coumarate--CoA ligase n=1 Tax=Pseudoduganella aquatica TaxID=2660641 RepID=A0A7X4HE93_9BURK|nr:4-coumarate--CoA ligase [Pseudoduganella aquatica]MYN09599.1 4-coumarate--CoA ligase [Pseudoduganella aquatica]
MSTLAPFAPTRPWWQQDSLPRLIADLARSELAAMRLSHAGLPHAPWSGELHFERDLGADSLERFQLATALSAALCMEQTGLDEQLPALPTLAGWCSIAQASLALQDAHISFRTSGSSGAPKQCQHALAQLEQEVQYWSGVLGPVKRILYTVPAHHIYGFLFTVLLPQALPDAPQLVDARATLPARLAGLARTGDLIVSFPDYWAGVAAAGQPFAHGVAGITSTAPCPDPVALQLQALGLDLLQIYGSSETAGIGWRRQAGEAYALLPYWDRTAQPGMLLRDGREVALQDTLDWRGERAFVPAGRIDQAVQVGGVNVHPAATAAVLERHPGVAQASVRLMRPDEGQRLKAFIVPAPAGAQEAALAAELAAWARAHLTMAARPVSFTFGSNLPRTKQGKLADWIIDAGNESTPEQP